MTKEAQKKWGFRDTAPKEFKEELLNIDRVTRVTAWGRQLRFRASVVIGDGKWRVWLGIGKAWEVVVAIEKAVRDAKKNIVKFQIVEWTIAHNVTADFKSASVMLHPASQGTWIIAGWAVRKIISVSWIRDIIGKRYGCNNAITNARATIKALSLIKTVNVVKKSETVTTQVEVKSETPKAVEKKEEIKVIKEEVKKEVKTVETKKPATKKSVVAKKETTKKPAPKKAK